RGGGGGGEGEGDGEGGGACCPGAAGGTIRSGRAWGVVLISLGSTPGTAGTAAGMDGAVGVAAGAGAPGGDSRPAPARPVLGTLGTVSDTSLTMALVVFSEALRSPSMYSSYALAIRAWESRFMMSSFTSSKG